MPFITWIGRQDNLLLSDIGNERESSDKNARENETWTF